MSNKITFLIAFILLILWGISSNLFAQPKATIKGNIKDAKTGEAIMGSKYNGYGYRSWHIHRLRMATMFC